MSQINGNDYADFADDQMNYIYESGQLQEAGMSTQVLFQALNAVVQSNLAVAYEQRTANLIAFSDVLMKSGVGPETIDEAGQRLGIGESDE